ncbi:MAG: hypothetical protein IT445_13850 [Phycisphaeraceae bacterium]|nr:hypothetical protein [Phycisphaeraceae bacterium]
MFRVFAPCCVLLSAALATAAAAQDFSLVPGEVIAYLESPNRTITGSISDANKKYLSSPSITILPNGDYIVSHDIFGDGTTQDTTKVYRSTDQGVTWSLQATVTDAFASTIFQHNGSLYLWGYREYYTENNNADILVRQSTDNGQTWTSPTNSSNGLLMDTNLYGQANTPTIYNGRLWIALAGKRVMSAPVGANLLLASSWTASDSANTSATPWGGNELSVTEAQVASSSRDGVVVMPKIEGLPHSIVMRAISPSTMTNYAAAADYVDLPGGEKKFALQYDSVSDKYYIVSNPILPAHADATIAPGLIRNTAALLSSRDLRHWDVEQLFLYTPQLDHDLPGFQGTFGEGFQYMNFAIEGDDLLVVSRTAFDTEGDRSQTGQNIPPRGHDSNLITFHRIEDFRSADASHKLVLDAANNRVLRHETTQYQDAPLGVFQLGYLFAGSPLTAPNGIAQDSNGNVYVRETGGRILRFDSFGNFIATAASLPPGLAFTSAPLAINQPAEGERSWTRNGGGDWDELTNWYYWGRPDTNYEVATFGSAITSNATINLSGNYIGSFTCKGLRFRSDYKYTIAGSGSLVLASDVGHAVLDLQRGQHEIQTTIRLDSDTDAILAAGSTLTLSATLNLHLRTLNLSGPGTLNIDGNQLSMSGGSMLLSNNANLAVSNILSITGGSTLGGNGTVTGFVANGGCISPGTSPGLLIINGALVQSATGKLKMEWAQGGYDLLGVTGNVTFDGTLDLSLLDEFTPAIGQSITIISAAAVSGTFDTITGVNVTDDLALAVRYHSNTVTVTAAIPGDANLDNLVNLADLQILGDHWQSSSATWSLGDYTGDGLVNLADLQVLGDHWNPAAGDFAALSQNIPEPQALVLWLGGQWLLLTRRKRAAGRVGRNRTLTCLFKQSRRNRAFIEYL